MDVHETDAHDKADEAIEEAKEAADEPMMPFADEHPSPADPPRQLAEPPEPAGSPDLATPEGGRD